MKREILKYKFRINFNIVSMVIFKFFCRNKKNKNQIVKGKNNIHHSLQGQTN